MPYQKDPDYKQSFIFSIKNLLNNIPVDITIFDSHQTVEIYTEESNISLLESLPMVKKVYEVGDRGMLADERIFV